MKRTIAIVEELIAKSETDLYIQMAKSSEYVIFGSSEKDDEELENFGKHLFAKWLDSVREQLCGDSRLIEYRANSKTHSTDIILTVLDIVLATRGGIPVLVASAMVVKFGLDKICSKVS